MIQTEEKGTKLRVSEALQDDAYKGIARIDFDVMRQLGIKRGDVILIKGSKETVAIADKAYPADVGEGIIRIDGIIRKNARIGVGENVAVKRTEIKEAKKVIIAPAQRGIMIQGNLKPGLLGRAVVKGDIVVLGGVRRRMDLMSEDMESMFGGFGDIFGDAFGGMGFGGGLQQIRFIIVNATPNAPCVITENTEVVFSSKPVEVSEETNFPEVTYEDIGGLSEEVKKVREMVELPLKHPEIFERLGIEPPKGVLLHGPPGTGKTLLAKAVANESEANFILLNGPECMSKFYGESEKRIRDIFDEAEKNAPSIIFIDEIDAIAPKREDVGGEVERRVVSQLLTMMDGLQSRGKVVVIAATNRPNAIDEALRRPGRFDREVELRAPDKNGRLQILKIHTRNMPLTKDVNLNALAEITHGFVGADISSLAKEAAMVVIRRVLPKIELKENESIPEEVLSELKVYKKDFDDALKVVRPSAMREVLVETPDINWNDVGGLDSVKQELKEAVEWPLKYPDSFIRLGIRPPRGILLYGPPGTGKTLLAKAVAKESEANFIQIKGPSLLSMWVGESLPYDEELIVKENGIVKRMKIGDIVEKKADVEVLAFDKDKRIRFTKIEDYIKHPLTGNLLEVTTRTGRKIKVTDYHSLFSFVNGKFTDIPSSHLIAGESYIAIPRNLNLPRENIRNINLYEYFKNDKDVFVSNINDYLIRAKKILGLKRIAELLKVSKKYLADLIYKNLPASINNFDNLINESKLALDFKEIKIKLKGSLHEYPVIFNLNKDFWRLVGIWIAEGDFNGYTIRIHNQNKEIREDIRKICNEFGFNLSEMKTCVTINSLFLQKIFEDVFGLEGGAGNKNLPLTSFILDKESKANLLKGYFSGDGSIYSAERGKFKIEAGTISKKLANDLMYLLLDFGIVSTLYQKQEITGNTTYRISILGVKNFERFKEIGFIDNLRNSRISQYIDSRKWSRSDLLPLGGELYNLASNSNNVYSTNNSIGKDKLKEILVYVDKDKTKYPEYWDLVEGDIYFDLVKEIKVVAPEEYVYDVSVLGEQNFVAGFGGIIAHNSEKGVRKIFERARQVAPCIIFFDEIDSLAGKRGIEQGTKVTERVLNQLLAEMDGIEDLSNVIVIGATNRPDMLDSALLRPGRFDRILLTPAPGKEGREEIFKIHTKNMPLARDVSINKILDKTEGFVGADMEALIRESAMLALRENIDSKEVKMKHFEDALKKVSASVTKSDSDKYKKIEQEYLRSAKAALETPASYLG